LLEEAGFEPLPSRPTALGRLDRLTVDDPGRGSFSAVARELGTGQPAISKQVAALEEHLGAQLLLRTSRSLSLTEAGRDFTNPPWFQAAGI